MQRNLVTLATVISIKPLGENNASVCVLTQSQGILYVTLYGGPKSRLKSLVSTWNTGTMYLSLSKGIYKISDFDVKSYHLTFREDIYKSCAASLAAEIAMKTHCAGNNERCWALVNGFLNGLEICSEQAELNSGLMRFLWRYLELLGIQPESGLCCHCGNVMEKGGEYVPSENGFICSSCNHRSGTFFVNAEGLFFLTGISRLSPKEASALVLSPQALGQVKTLIFYLIESACGVNLLTLKTAAGIL